MTDSVSSPGAAGTASPPRPLRAPLLAFALDVALAVLMTFSAMTAGYLGWAVWQSFRIAGQTGGALDPATLQVRIGTPSPLALIVLTLVSTGGTALALYFWRRRAGPQERAASLAAAARPRTWLLAGGAGIATFLLSSLLTWSGRRFGLDPDPTNLALIEAVVAQHPVFLGLFAVVLAPLYEELLFRRVLFGRLWQAGWPMLGLVLSSLAFALTHETPGLAGNPLPATLFLIAVYAGMGAMFAAVYRATGTLWAPIAAHMLNNGLALAVLQVYGGAQV